MATTPCPAWRSMTPSNRHYIGRPSIQVMGTLQEPTFSFKNASYLHCFSQKSQPCQRRMEVGEEGVWDSDVALSAELALIQGQEAPNVGTNVFFRCSLCCIKDKPGVEIPYKVFMEKILFQSAMCFHILFTFMRVEELQHFMGVAQLCKMRLLRTPGSTNKIVHCELFSSGRYFFPFTCSDNCQCNIFLLLFY